MDKKNIKILLVVASIAIFIFACVSSVLTINYYNRKMQCLYNGVIYNNGEKFMSADNCNSCACNNGEVACTLKACLNQNNPNIPTKGLEIYCYRDGNNQMYSILPGTNRQKTYDEVTGEDSNASSVKYHINKTKEDATNILIDQFEYSKEDADAAVTACTPAERLVTFN